MTLDQLLSAAEAWMAVDPDPAMREATAALIAQADAAVLREHFGQRLQFGTAGIRGVLGPGPSRMNRLLVQRVSLGLADYLLSDGDDATTRGVVIGFDGRHLSREFAEDTAALMALRGIPVWLYADVAATPQLSHAVVALGCAAGVMVTASHNPPSDNGYKVYWSNGAQIIPPHDRGISAAIDQVGGIPELEPVDALLTTGRVRRPPVEVLDAYLAEVADLRVHPTRPLTLVYTAMHGVGRALIERVLGDAGYTVHLVAEQADPHPDFPTVAFPNPEEPGAMDLALARGRALDADLILANDPDADRLAVAVPDGQGGYRQLTGDQMGLLLAEDLLANDSRFSDVPRMVSSSVVSSSMLAEVAAHHGAAYQATLTGFKWIATGAIAWDGRFVLGYEEALGYSVGPVVHDKDGISAALVAADLVADCLASGETLLDRLDALYRRHGMYVSTQRSLKRPGTEGAAAITAMMERFRAEPPATIGGDRVVRVRDVLTGVATDTATGETSEVGLPPSNVLVYDLERGRVIVRPSGTEPKIKFYFEAREPVADDEPVAAAEARAVAQMDAQIGDMLPS